MVDTLKLKRLMLERGHSLDSISKKLHINRSTLYRKLKQGGSFTVKELNSLIEVIPLSHQEASDIFFVRTDNHS